MRNMHPILSCLALVALASGAATAADAREGGGDATWRLRAFVPVACWVRPESPVLAEAGASGRVVEACNSPGGFIVSANYRSLAASETARMTYGDQVIDLAGSGEQILRRSTIATIKTVDYRFDGVVLQTPLVLSLTIQPI